jgi:hypothetical protein
MIQKRRRHTKEFKEQAVKLVTDKGYSVSEAARNLTFFCIRFPLCNNSYSADLILDSFLLI